jgi:DNA-binding NarL/FixJ family response regulator
LTVWFPKVSVGGANAPTHPESIASDPLSTTAVVARPAPTRGLSPRELEVLKNVAAGLSDKQVAGRLGISPKTVRNHLSQIFSKLQAGNRVEAVINALSLGLLNV